MTAEGALLAEKVAAIERHLDRVAARLPSDPGALVPMSDASDAVILHLWQAVQAVIESGDRAICARFSLPSETPADGRRLRLGDLDRDQVRGEGAQGLQAARLPLAPRGR